MRRPQSDIIAILPTLGAILFTFGVVMLTPLCFVFIRPGETEVEPLTFILPAALADIKGFPHECLIVGIYREEADEFVVPRGNAKIKAEDQVFLTSPAEGLAKAARFLAPKKKK